VDSHPQLQPPRPTTAAAGLLLVAALLCSSGCATTWPVVGQFEAPPSRDNTAVAVTVSDSAARVRANAPGDVVPVDAPVAGTARLDDLPTAATERQNPSPGVAVSEPKQRPRAEAGHVFRRLEAALDGSGPRPSPPPPPLAHSTRPVVTSSQAVTGPIEPVGGSDSLIPPASVPILGIAVEATLPEIPSKTPRDLKPAPAVAAVVQLTDVTDWSGSEAQGSLAAVPAETATTSGSAVVMTRTAPWWITVIGLVAMVGLIGLSRRFGWPSVSPLD